MHKARRPRPDDARGDAACLDEAVGLAAAIDLEIVAAEIIQIARLRPSTLFGAGAVEEIGHCVADHDISVVCIAGRLTPVQQRNLERAWNCKVIDRAGLILEIFGERARTREGTLQVELAHLSYQRSRLVRSWTHLERQRGGFGFLGGPGETQIEADRRQIGDRIARIERELESVRRTRGLHRRARKRANLPVIALVGYTNAGKSTLFNRLSSAQVTAKDMLFATLDPTMRQIRLPSGRAVILSDTVGFISDLPPDLIAAFRATLEEVTEADIVVHVRDGAHPDSEAQRGDVLAILDEIGVEEVGVEMINKSDLMGEAERERLTNIAARDPVLVVGSAMTGHGLDALERRIDALLQRDQNIVEISVALSDGAAMAFLYRNGEVVERTDSDGFAHFRVGLTPADLARFERDLG